MQSWPENKKSANWKFEEEHNHDQGPEANGLLEKAGSKADI